MSGALEAGGWGQTAPSGVASGVIALGSSVPLFLRGTAANARGHELVHQILGVQRGVAGGVGALEPQRSLCRRCTLLQADRAGHAQQRAKCTSPPSTGSGSMVGSGPHPCIRIPALGSAGSPGERRAGGGQGERRGQEQRQGAGLHLQCYGGMWLLACVRASLRSSTSTHS